LAKPERPEPERHGAPDPAETDQAPGFARQFGGLQRHLLPSALAHTAVGGNQLPQQGQSHGNGVLSHADGISGWRIGHSDSPVRTSFDVNMLVTVTWLLDQLKRSRLSQQFPPDASLESIVSEDDVRFGEDFSKLFCAHVVASNKVRIGSNSWRDLDQEGFEYFDGDWRH
jgi:hypothetical protein